MQQSGESLEKSFATQVRFKTARGSVRVRCTLSRLSLIGKSGEIRQKFQKSFPTRCSTINTGTGHCLFNGEQKRPDRQLSSNFHMIIIESCNAY